MKITESCIDYNVVRIIDENSLPWEVDGATDDLDHDRLVTSGYIRGVLDLAKALKEVIKA